MQAGNFVRASLISAVVWNGVVFGADSNVSGEISFLTQSIKLSEISESYDDVTGGTGWAFSYLRTKGENFRIGGGTFGLSGKSKDTEIGIYGGGLISEGVLPIDSFELTGNVQLGGASVTATSKEIETESSAVNAGEFTQSGGWLIAPQASVGYNFDSVRVYGFARRTQFLSGSNDAKKFSYTIAGIGVASLF